MERYVVIDDFLCMFPSPVLDEEGYMLVFESEEEAQNHAKELQNGKVFKL